MYVIDLKIKIFVDVFIYSRLQLVIKCFVNVDLVCDNAGYIVTICTLNLSEK